MIKRRFELTTSLGTVTAYPANSRKLVYKWKRNKDSLNFEKTLETKLIFRNDSKQAITDFTFLYEFEKTIATRCEEIICKIYKICTNGTETLEYTGIMPLKSGEWDLDTCTVSLSLEPQNDIYDCIRDNFDETDVSVTAVMPFYNGGPDVTCGYTVSDYDTNDMGYYFGYPPNGAPFGLYNIPIPGTYNAVYSYDLTVCVTMDGQSWTAVGHNLWARTHPSDPSGISSGKFNVYDEQISGMNNFLTTTRVVFNNYFFNDRQDPSNSSFYTMPFQSFAVLCYTIVAELLVKCDRDAALPMLRSDFFDWNPVGDTPGYIPSSIAKLPNNLSNPNYPDPSFKYIYLPRTPGINYVTGQTNHLTHLHYFPKSNIKNISASEWEQPQTPSLELSDNKLTFEEIESIWSGCFQAYWFIDTDGCMRVEHLSWFNNNSVLFDSTIAPHSNYNKANNKYAYVKELMPRKEKFYFDNNRDYLNGRAETTNANKNNEILYDSVCVDPDPSNNEKEYLVKKVVTDMQAVDASNNGFDEDYDNNGIFLCTVTFDAPTDTSNDTGGVFKNSLVIANVDEETHYLNADVTLYENGHVQWSNLIRRYLRDNRVLLIGKNGPDDITFSSRTRKHREQKNVILLHCCGDEEFNPNQGQIVTGLGTGDIFKAEQDTETNTIKITALHD